MKGNANLAVAAQGLRKRYADGKEALDGLDLAVSAGEIFGLLGPNGAGKTTAIQILTTLLTPTAGEARVFGQDVVRCQEAVRRAIGVALQASGVDPLLTGVEALELQSRLYGASRAEAVRRARELSDSLHLEDFAHRRIAVYSGGMRRRLDLALGLVHRPRILFLDEPTTGLDPLSRNALWDLVRTVRADAGTTVFVSTQYLEEADALCDRIAILRAGRIVAEDTPARLKSRMRRDVIELVPADPADTRALFAVVDGIVPGAALDREAVCVAVADGAQATRRLLAAAQDAGIDLAGLRVAPPTLDDVFLEITRGEGSVASAKAERMAPDGTFGGGR
jgi:ABC-2 type transport system ATP-binding protein